MSPTMSKILCTRALLCSQSQQKKHLGVSHHSQLAFLESEGDPLLLLEFDVVPNHAPVVGSQEDVIVGRAVIVARTRPDHHHLAHKGVSLWAPEFHIGSVGCVRSAASPIYAAATEFGPVGTCTCTACKLKAGCPTRLGVPCAFLSILK